MQRPDEFNVNEASEGDANQEPKGNDVGSNLPDANDTSPHDETGVWHPDKRPAQKTDADRSNTQFGDYKLMEELGRGGMGVVYRAQQFPVDRMVALKMVLGGRFACPKDVERFYLEAKAAAKLSHPNIVPVFEAGETEGQHYYSMELIEGQSLAEKSKSSDLSFREIATYLKKVSQAVHYAHESGVLHRDLKPTNILIDENDEPRIADFGLAKHEDDNSGLTRSGAAVGTPNYMAPEQAAANIGEIGPSSDVYSLGAMLYELIVGRPPLVGETVVDTLNKVVHDEPVPPRKENRECPRDLESICLKCLRKKPNGRYESAAALADDLERFLAGRPVQASSISAMQRVWYWTREIPLIAALIGRPTMGATKSHRLVQSLSISAVLLSVVSYAIFLLLPTRLPDKIVVATGQPDGFYQEIFNRFAPLIRQTSSRTVNAFATSGSEENCQRLIDGDVHLAILQEDSEAFDPDRIQIVSPLYFEPVLFVVRKQSNIATIEAIRGKSVLLGRRRSGSNVTALNLLNHYEVELNELRPVFESSTEIFNDTSIDAAIVTIGLSSDFIRRLVADDQFAILSLRDPQELSLHNHNYFHMTLRRDQFSMHAATGLKIEIDDKIETVATTAFLGVATGASDELVESALGALYQANNDFTSENQLIPKEEIAKWRDLNLHPAARRFFSKWRKTRYND